MVINKILNNNAAIILKNDKKVVVMGRGITFQKKKGDEIDESLVTEIFYTNKNSEKLLELIEEIPYEYFQLTEKIVKYAETQLDKKLHENIYLTLTDHINFTIANYRNEIKVRNSMLWDVKRLYKKEFEIAKQALTIIKEETGVELLEDEAASIALHVVNGEINKNIPEIVGMMEIVQEILNIVKYTLKLDFSEESLNYFRFITHLKFLAERIFSDNYYEDNDYELFEMICGKYGESYACSKKIEEYIYQTYNKMISKDELIYLTLHIERIKNKKE